MRLVNKGNCSREFLLLCEARKINSLSPSSKNWILNKIRKQRGVKAHAELLERLKK